METKEITRLDLAKGGTILKQGHYETLAFTPRNANGEVVDLTDKTIDVVIVNGRSIVYETTGTFDIADSEIKFAISENFGHGDMWMEITVTDPADATYRQKFPTSEYEGRLKFIRSADDVDYVGFSGKTVAVFEADQAEFKNEMQRSFDLAVAAVSPDAEVADARGGEVLLGTRLDKDKQELTLQLAETGEELDKTYSSSESFNPIVVAREKGRHIAFGSIARVATLDNISLPNLNLIVYRSGINHQDDGMINGVYVSDKGSAIGEPFTIAKPADYLNIGRGGIETPNDFRDPNLLRLSDGRILLSFFALNFAADSTRTQAESYAMIGAWSDVDKTLSWSAPSLLFPNAGNLLYGKPFEESGNIYSAIYTHGTLHNPDGLSRGLVGKSTLTNPLVWEVVGQEVYAINGFDYSEPILRPRPNGGYFVQVRRQGGGVIQIHRYDANTIDGAWSGPVVIYEGSAHAKGLEILADGHYFTGIRQQGVRPGVGILTTTETADTPSPLQLSGMIYTSQIGSDESGYLEFLKVSEEEYLGTFFSETGRTIQTFLFTLSMIKNKKVKNIVTPINKMVSPEKVDPHIHIGTQAIRSHNLLTNPLVYTPFGFANPPGWIGAQVTKSTGNETDSPGAGYPKVTMSASSFSSRLNKIYSRLYAGHPIKAAARIYCKYPNRIRLLVTFGTEQVSVYHSGKGWETLSVNLKHRSGYSVHSSGVSADTITYSIYAKTGDAINYYIDWTTVGFGEVIPEVVNDFAERLLTFARLPLNAKINTFNLSDLGFATGQSTYNLYPVNILSSNFEIVGYTVARTATSFTITLVDGSLWGSNKFAEVEIIGLG